MRRIAAAPPASRPLRMPYLLQGSRCRGDGTVATGAQHLGLQERQCDGTSAQVNCGREAPRKVRVFSVLNIAQRAKQRAAKEHDDARTILLGILAGSYITDLSPPSQ